MHCFSSLVTHCLLFFTVDVLVQTDEQQFFYCSVAKHCEKGMFGMVQPKMGGNNTVSFHMQNWLDSVCRSPPFCFTRLCCF